jgi:hypothetical protein
VVAPGPADGGGAKRGVKRSGDLEAEARELAAGLLADGMKPSEAAKELAARLGLARNEAYRVVQHLAEESIE